MLGGGTRVGLHRPGRAVAKGSNRGVCSRGLPVWRFHLEHAGPAGGVVGRSKFGEAIAIVGASSEDEFVIGSEFEQRAAGEVGALAVDLIKPSHRLLHYG